MTERLMNVCYYLLVSFHVCSSVTYKCVVTHISGLACQIVRPVIMKCVRQRLLISSFAIDNDVDVNKARRRISSHGSLRRSSSVAGPSPSGRRFGPFDTMSRVAESMKHDRSGYC